MSVHPIGAETSASEASHRGISSRTRGAVQACHASGGAAFSGRKPTVIVAVRNAERIARRNPTAFVVDHETISVWHGEEFISLSLGKRRTNLFAMAAAFLYAAGGHVEHETIYQIFYGARADGGPDHPENVFQRYVDALRPFLAWAGIKVRSRYGYHDYECRWTATRTALAHPIRLSTSGIFAIRGARGARAQFLEAAE